MGVHCYFCQVLKGDLVLLEHEAARWVEKEELDGVDWLPADRVIIEKVKKNLFQGHKVTSSQSH